MCDGAVHCAHFISAVLEGLLEQHQCASPTTNPCCRCCSRPSGTLPPPLQDGSLGHQLPPEQRNAQCKRQEASLGALSSKGVFDALPLGCNYAVGHFDFR